MTDPVDQQAREDLALIRRVLAGDGSALEPLSERLVTVPRLIAAVDRRRGNRLAAEELEDLGQDVLLIVWQKLDRFEGTGTLETWLYRFCHLEYLNRIRRRGRARSRTQPDTEAIEETVDSVPPQHDLEALEQALVDLGPPDEPVIRLKHFDSLTFDQVGARLDISTNTAKRRYYRGIAWLQRRLESRTEGRERHRGPAPGPEQSR